jgi:hypothetical protein
MPSGTSLLHIGAILMLSGSVWLWTGGHPFAVEPEKPHDRDGHAIHLLATRCTMCHSADLIAQQRLNRSRWSATLDKMTQWGAQLDQHERTLLLEYLSQHYHGDTKPSVPP